MTDIEEKIKSIKENSSRENFYFMRRRVEKGNGKKTLGWILQDNSENLLTENIDFNKIHDYKLKMEK